jgi:hypothetical protein
MEHSQRVKEISGYFLFLLYSEGGKRIGRTLSFDHAENVERSAGNHVSKRSRHKHDASANSTERLTSYKSET